MSALSKSLTGNASGSGDGGGADGGTILYIYVGVAIVTLAPNRRKVEAKDELFASWTFGFNHRSLSNAGRSRFDVVRENHQESQRVRQPMCRRICWCITIYITT